MRILKEIKALGKVWGFLKDPNLTCLFYQVVFGLDHLSRPTKKHDFTLRAQLTLLEEVSGEKYAKLY